jgi:hypothetical protein
MISSLFSGATPEVIAAQFHMPCSYQDRAILYPTYLYTAASTYFKYGNFTGNSSYLTMQSSSFYKVRKVDLSYSRCHTRLAHTYQHASASITRVL